MGALTNIELGHRVNVKKSSETRVIQMLRISSASAVLKQTSTTTEETWTGLKQSDALNLCISSETSIKGTTTRNYLGAAKITLASGGVSTWNTIEACWGTKVSSQMSRIGDTNLWQVSRTTVITTVANIGGTLELL